MSLINDALKKAARQRAEDHAEVAPATLTGGRKRIPRRGAPMTVKTLVFLVGGAGVLIVGSVIITFVLVTGKPEPKPAAVASTVEITPTPLPAPVVVVSMPVVPAVSVARPTLPPPTAAPVFVAAVPSATPPPVVAAVAIPNIPARGAPTEAIKAPSAPLSRGERIQSFIDGLRVTGVRAAGSDSKALVDGHVYRVNDMLDRALGLRLVQVDADHLTLVDSGGVTYIKSF